MLAQILSQCSKLDEPPITVDELLRRYVRAVLVAHSGNRSTTALALGIDRKTLYRWIVEKGFTSDAVKTLETQP